ncbi:uncharacterized protein LOC122257026 [Penaeus japonicus]|uniref:uncharacterized protein LOC122257026 n=1 Tax=Penaeus japonicus TaxID=27405 RepID=UPI001C716EED|nr:uncharacterized protein LOC122257026 [Penaeus japonicus]
MQATINSGLGSPVPSKIWLLKPSATMQAKHADSRKICHQNARPSLTRAFECIQDLRDDSLAMKTPTAGKHLKKQDAGNGGTGTWLVLPPAKRCTEDRVLELE